MTRNKTLLGSVKLTHLNVGIQLKLLHVYIDHSTDGFGLRKKNVLKKKQKNRNVNYPYAYVCKCNI